MNRRDALKQFAALGALALPASRPVFAQETYRLIDPVQPTDDPSRIEVIKFFHYGCPHCADLAPLLHEWDTKARGDDVYLLHSPVVWNNDQLRGLATLYFAMHVSGEDATLHPQIFAAVQQARLPLHTEAGVEAWIQDKVKDPAAFMDAYRSFGVRSMVQRADQQSRSMRVNGVPTLVVNGKYLTSSAMAGGHEAAIVQIEELIRLARAER